MKQLILNVDHVVAMKLLLANLLLLGNDFYLRFTLLYLYFLLSHISVFTTVKKTKHTRIKINGIFIDKLQIIN